MIVVPYTAINCDVITVQKKLIILYIIYSQPYIHHQNRRKRSNKRIPSIIRHHLRFVPLVNRQNPSIRPHIGQLLKEFQIPLLIVIFVGPRSKDQRSFETVTPHRLVCLKKNLQIRRIAKVFERIPFQEFLSLIDLRYHRSIMTQGLSQKNRLLYRRCF